MKKILRLLEDYERLLIKITCLVVLTLTAYQFIKTKVESIRRENQEQRLEPKQANPRLGECTKATPTPDPPTPLIWSRHYLPQAQLPWLAIREPPHLSPSGRSK